MELTIQAICIILSFLSAVLLSIGQALIQSKVCGLSTFRLIATLILTGDRESELGAKICPLYLRRG